ncbi:MAG: flavodoxin domain-containing protein [Desulfobulbaceae bacterium]|jgi:flavodoxin|nr:flavodoxin domain-containing protein [Desulfobulbaceae bacterium]
MKKALIVYASRTGKTKAMAEYLAEGLRMTGCQVDVKKIADIDKAEQMASYDGYLFGCPTYHKDITDGMKKFLFKAKLAKLDGKWGGAFGSHTHSGESPVILYETMQYVCKMKMTNLGPLRLTEEMVGTSEGLKACQDYGRAFGEKM